jgi:hypothetical protein
MAFVPNSERIENMIKTLAFDFTETTRTRPDNSTYTIRASSFSSYDMKEKEVLAYARGNVNDWEPYAYRLLSPDEQRIRAVHALNMLEVVNFPINCPTL